MRGSDFLEVANALDQYRGQEWDRTRIGRLYYGVYLEYRQFCIDELGMMPKKFAREHQIVNDMLGELDKDLSDLLRELRFSRNQADYDLAIPADVIAERLTTAEPLARALMQRLDELRASS